MTALNPTERFYAPEVTKVYFVPAIADTALAYTRAEITAGSDLTNEIADISGWGVKANMIDVPDLGRRFVSQIGGRISTDASSITFWADKAGDDVRTVLPRGTRGFIVFMDGGDVAGQPSDVFPVEVTAVGKPRSLSDAGRQITIDFAITAVPGEDVDIPAAA